MEACSIERENAKGALSSLRVRIFSDPPSPSGRAFTSDDNPILYASSSMQTCLAEINPKIGEVFTIAHFTYSRLVGGDFWFVGQLSDFHKSQESSRYLENSNAVEKPFYYPGTALHSWVFKDALLNQIFSELLSAEDGYVLNRLVIDYVRKKLPEDSGFHGVVFKSVKDPPGVNFAVFGDAIGHLELQGVNLVEVTDIDPYGYVAYRLLKNGRAEENGTINWPEHEFRPE